MEEKTTEKVSAGARGRIGGASIAWVTLYGALCGVFGLVPIFPYVGGGGYVPLTTPFCAIWVRGAVSLPRPSAGSSACSSRPLHTPCRWLTSR